MLTMRLLLKQASGCHGNRYLHSFSAISSCLYTPLYPHTGQAHVHLNRYQHRAGSGRTFLVQQTTGCSSYRTFCSKKDSEAFTVENNPEYDKPEDEEGPFRVIFKYPNIHLASSMTKLKLTTIGINLICLPYMLRLFTSGLPIPFNYYVATGSLLFLSLWFVNVGRVAGRIAIRIYVNDDTEQVKISHMNFWGRRRDVIMNPKDMFGELAPNKVYLTLHARDKSELFSVYLNQCTVEQRNEMRRIFGDFFEMK